MNMQTDKTSVAPPATVADIKRILQMIPHRYPMLMVDRVVDMKLDHSAVGIKNVTINEPFFIGHFPGAPIMPGVLIIEAMAQAAAIVVMAHLTSTGKIPFFMTIDGAKFRRPVVPGDQLRIHISKQQQLGLRRYRQGFIPQLPKYDLQGAFHFLWHDLAMGVG